MSAMFMVAPPSGPHLRDIHLPPEPSWWPPAPGWWMLAVLVLLLAGTLLWYWRRRRRLGRRIAVAMAEIDMLAGQHAIDGDNGALAAGLHQLLRRAARRRDPASVHLRGAAWRQLLEQVPTDAQTVAGLLQLEEALYQPKRLEPSVALRATRRWLGAALRQPGAGHA